MSKERKSNRNYSRSNFNFRHFLNYLKKQASDFAKFVCGTENNGKASRSGFWAMLSTISTIILLIIAYSQLQGINETTAADFSYKIKNDLFTSKKIRLMTLFDNNILNFKSDSSENIWFEVDTIQYKQLPLADNLNDIPFRYNVLEIDELLQDFEDLSFYEKKGQEKIDYIYNQYAYYIEMLWENPEIANYIRWQRNQKHFSYSYRSLENLYKKMKAISDNQP